MGEAKRHLDMCAFRLVLKDIQPVQCISEWANCEPSNWLPENVPDVDDARPKRCPSCRHPAKLAGRVILHGHGWRERRVVVLPAVDKGLAEVGECWVRRYRCTECRAVRSVLPRGVLPRYLYSAWAIVSAFFLVAERPVGDGLRDVEAYERQGMYRRVRRGSTCPFRWRSIGRWAGLIPQWWPERAALHPQELLLGFIERARGSSRQEALGSAIASHVAWGGAM